MHFFAYSLFGLFLISQHKTLLTGTDDCF